MFDGFDQGKSLGAGFINNTKPISVGQITALVIQVLCFAILYAVWVLPGTIALRNACLGLGAVLSIYPIYASRNLLLQKRAWPIWLIIALFGWVMFHFLLLSQDPITQLAELNSIWKRAAIGGIFAFGMSLSITRLANSNQSSKKSKSCLNVCWIIFYIGLLAPTLIYIVKLLLTSYGPRFGLTVPVLMQMYIGSNAAYVAKTAYVAFCLPVFAVALSSLLRNITMHRWLSLSNVFYLATLPAVITVFHYENIKNGVVYGIVLVLIFLISLMASIFQGRWLFKTIFAGVVLAVSLFFLNLHLQKNESWKSFSADAKIAWNTGQYSQWKYGGERGYPTNEAGATVSGTNYERIAWAKEGVRLIAENPLGYGLVERSFGYLAKLRWPDSKLHQSHSGWIDLALGIGVPGAALLLGSILILIKQLGSSSVNFKLSSWVVASRWALLCLLFMWCTTEISQKVYLESMIFWIAIASGINLGLTTKSKPQIAPNRAP